MCMEFYIHFWKRFYLAHYVLSFDTTILYSSLPLLPCPCCGFDISQSCSMAVYSYLPFSQVLVSMVYIFFQIVVLCFQVINLYILFPGRSWRIRPQRSPGIFFSRVQGHEFECIAWIFIQQDLWICSDWTQLSMAACRSCDQSLFI